MIPEQAGPSVSGPAVLDIGPGLGALLVYTSSELLGGEIEMEPAGGTGSRVHTGVHERTAGGLTFAAALFPGLTPGLYALLGPGSGERRPVHIREGEVSELDCR